MNTRSIPPVQTVETISVDEAIIVLARVNHAMPIAFTALVDANCRVKAWVDAREPQPTKGWSKPPIELGEMAELRMSPYKEVKKLSKVQAFTGAVYENSVNRQAVREGNAESTFQAKERQWGTRISEALVKHENKWYLAVHVLRTASPIYRARGNNGLLATVTKEQIAPYLPPDRTAEVAEAQGVEKPVIYRNYLLDNIVSFALEGKRYKIMRSSGASMVVPTAEVTVTKAKPVGVKPKPAAESVIPDDDVSEWRHIMDVDDAGDK